MIANAVAFDTANVLRKGGKWNWYHNGRLGETITVCVEKFWKNPEKVWDTATVNNNLFEFHTSAAFRTYEKKQKTKRLLWIMAAFYR